MSGTSYSTHLSNHPEQPSVLWTSLIIGTIHCLFEVFRWWVTDSNFELSVASLKNLKWFTQFYPFKNILTTTRLKLQRQNSSRYFVSEIKHNKSSHSSFDSKIFVIACFHLKVN
jgi:hypothetical protein